MFVAGRRLANFHPNNKITVSLKMLGGIFIYSNGACYITNISILRSVLLTSVINITLITEVKCDILSVNLVKGQLKHGISGIIR